jgi:aryl-alcohol dehydrogenase-like predicted oxidoreductase
VNHREDFVPLGSSELRVSPLGIGTWAWGDRLFWGYGRGGYTDSDLVAAYQVSRAAGINFFDTAEVYGRGRSERLLGRFARAVDDQIVMATKFFPYPWRWRRTGLVRALRGSLKRLGLDRVDLYQIHWPFPPVPGPGSSRPVPNPLAISARPDRDLDGWLGRCRRSGAGPGGRGV